ncbi:hypothetical protein DUNSADRAFT_15354 [Dunaliella salina]|uniref:Uncharacterized protein n=1 Tax=Dunaliella salina TaxID=3046 RepID=A0ABQ7H1U3_DUNSA|nr:hypothetical protein DUNSADRAFT_15354 [Dunaliella salina]|eukprot:KAF5840812.1 hypothetical protein DUNSADRAFT_15354 [Dunaliella salina]
MCTSCGTSTLLTTRVRTRSKWQQHDEDGSSPCCRSVCSKGNRRDGVCVVGAGGAWAQQQASAAHCWERHVTPLACLRCQPPALCKHMDTSSSWLAQDNIGSGSCGGRCRLSKYPEKMHIRLCALQCKTCCVCWNGCRWCAKGG